MGILKQKRGCGWIGSAAILVALGWGGLVARAEDAPKPSLAGCLNALDFYDAMEFRPLLKAGKHPVVPAHDALGRKGFYVFSEGSDTADFHLLPPFAKKPGPYQPVVLDQDKDSTGYYFELQVGDEKIPIEYHDPKSPGGAVVIDPVYPGFGKLNQSSLKPAVLSGTGKDAVGPRAQAVLAAAARARLSKLAENYRRARKKAAAQVMANSRGLTPMIVNEVEGHQMVLAAIDQDLARDQAAPFLGPEGVEELKRRRAALVKQIEGKRGAIERRGLVKRYSRDQDSIKGVEKLSAQAVAVCKVAPIEGLARKMEGEIDFALREKVPEYRGASRADGAAGAAR